MFVFTARRGCTPRAAGVRGNAPAPRPAVARASAEALETRRLLSGLPAYPVFDFTGIAGADGPRAAVNGEAFVVGGSQRPLFRSDGTTPGTSAVATSVSALFDWRGTLFFNSNLPSSRLLKLDGGASDPVEIRDSTGKVLSNAHDFVAIGDKLFFATGNNSPNLYVTDGTSQGTRLLHTGTPVGRAGDLLIFWTYVPGASSGSLWRTDGTGAGTVMIQDNVDSPGWAGHDLGPVLLFNGSGGLWKTDGTAAGTVLVKQGVFPVREWERVGDALYAMASGTSQAGTLWKTDGTTAGTVSVDSMSAGTGLSPQIGPSMVHVGDTLYYVRGSGGGPQLYATQGPGTSRQVTFIGSGSSAPGVAPALAAVGDKILFPARSSGPAYELWESGGVSGDATKVQGPPAVGNSFDGGPLNLLPVGGSLFFTQATLNSSNSRLWRYGVTSAALDDDGVLGVSGTDPAEGVSGNDTISLTVAGDTVTATVNGTTRSFPLANVRRIAVDGFGGDDTLTATGLTAIPLVFNGETGQDALSVVGTPGDDTVAVTSFPAQGGVGTVHTSAVESLTVDALGGSDAVTFANLRSPATFHGGDGNDVLRFDDRGRLNAEDYVLGGTAFARSTAPGGAASTLLAFDGAETVSLQAGAGANVVTVTPHEVVRFDVDGGDPPAGGPQRDRLAVDAAGATGTHHEPGAAAGSGLWTFSDRQPVSYTAVEQTDDGVPLTADIVDVTPNPRKAPVPDVKVVFSKAVTGFDLSDLRLTREGSPDNLLGPQQTLATADGVTWTLGNLDALTTPDGRYTLSLKAGGSGITDGVGSPLAADTAEPFRVDNVAPHADVDDVTQDPRQGPVDYVRILFDEPITGLTADSFTLTRNGGPNLLMPGQSLIRVTDTIYSLGGLTALTTPAGEYVLRLDPGAGTPVTDLAGNPLAGVASDTWRNVSRVQGHLIFYNGSRADGFSPDADARDDAAIAPDKVALLPSLKASFANYTSYDRGINGVMIDIAGLAGELTAADFSFRVGNTADPSKWGAAPAPSGISVRPGAGFLGSDRVTITWPDYSIRNKWLEVWMLPDQVTGLQGIGDVFYYGNLAGETGNFPRGVGAKVDPGDLNATRNQYGMSGLPLTYRWDHNRDGRVNVLDTSIVLRNLNAAPLTLIQPDFRAPPASATSAAADARRAYRPGGRPPVGSLATAAATVAAVPNPGEFFQVGGTVYFTANDGVHGTELWRSDGTAAGTAMVADINPGPANSAPLRLTAVNGVLVFAANDGVHGEELWRTDGTAAGTYLLEDINPGAADSTPAGNSAADLTRRFVVGRVMYFSANRPDSGFELWRTDGTPYGTYPVRDITPGPDGASPQQMAVLNGQVVFKAGSGSDYGFWRSSGTAVGTVRFGGPITGDITQVTSSGGSVFFQLNTIDSSRNFLRKLDPGGAGPTVVADLGGTIAWRADVDGTLFMDVVVPGGGLLVKSDGTAAGTGPVVPASDPKRPDGPSLITSFAGAAFFVASGTTTGSELWRSDGTAAGTYVVKDIVAGTASGQPQSLTVAGGALYFTAVDTLTGGRQIWRTDGTEAGTVRLTSGAGGVVAQGTLAVKDGFVYFMAPVPEGGTGLWRTDGTEAGTTLVKNVNEVTPAPLAASAVSTHAGRATARDTSIGRGASVTQPALTPSGPSAPAVATSPRRRGAFESLTEPADTLASRGVERRRQVP